MEASWKGRQFERSSTTSYQNRVEHKSDNKSPKYFENYAQLPRKREDDRKHGRRQLDVRRAGGGGSAMRVQAGDDGAKGGGADGKAIACNDRS